MKFVIVFFNDILVCSLTMELHLKHLTQVLPVLVDNTFHLKKSKYSLGVTTIDCKGQIVSTNKVSLGPSKVEAIKQWKLPTNTK